MCYSSLNLALISNLLFRKSQKQEWIFIHRNWSIASLNIAGGHRRIPAVASLHPKSNVWSTCKHIHRALSWEKFRELAPYPLTKTGIQYLQSGIYVVESRTIRLFWTPLHGAIVNWINKQHTQVEKQRTNKTSEILCRHKDWNILVLHQKELKSRNLNIYIWLDWNGTTPINDRALSWDKLQIGDKRLVTTGWWEKFGANFINPCRHDHKNAI